MDFKDFISGSLLLAGNFFFLSQSAKAESCLPRFPGARRPVPLYVTVLCCALLCSSPAVLDGLSRMHPTPPSASDCALTPVLLSLMQLSCVFHTLLHRLFICKVCLLLEEAVTGTFPPRFCACHCVTQLVSRSLAPTSPAPTLPLTLFQPHWLTGALDSGPLHMRLTSSERLFPQLSAPLENIFSNIMFPNHPV